MPRSMWKRPDARAEPIHGPGLKPALAVGEPSVEFGDAAPTADPILDAALARLKK